jgi:hypothetical protein
VVKTDLANLYLSRPTRSLIGLPMFYRHTDEPPTLMARADVLSVFAEPGILHPNIITFHLDRDVAGIIGPFRFISRPGPDIYSL